MSSVSENEQTEGRTTTPCRCVDVEGYGIDRTACRAEQHRDEKPTSMWHVHPAEWPCTALCPQHAEYVVPGQVPSCVGMSGCTGGDHDDDCPQAQEGRLPSEYVTVRRDDLAAALGDAEHMQDEYGPCKNHPSGWIDRLRDALTPPARVPSSD